MSSRDLILGRVRRALADVRRDDTPYEHAFRRSYLREHGGLSPDGTVELLAENLADYRALVHRTDADGLAETIAGLLRARGSKTVLVPSGLREDWLSATDLTRVPDRGESTAHELDRADSVVTACALAIAETGTIVLDGSPDQGRRRITLVPDHHVCVVHVPDQVVSSVPQALELLDPVRPLTWISGPSATSDIELDRVEGVHGPRTLEVVLVSGGGGRGPE
ncbi:LutC/YkgG family protein [Streptomyces scabiei]|uniref:LutC/YkgG family protein n=1 Tax=Streptomyces scabiei TaxID=1930 RepID=UPI0029A0EE69|nr:lactate utilization protein C [Streptomyces scabiei]MDX3122599.1 lactate utilization protein C [Streptomyces scabiei]